MKKKRPPRLNFMQKLSLKLMEMKGQVEVSNEDKWIVYREGDKEISFSFDEKGENIDDIGVFQDIIEVTGQKKLF